MNSLSKSKLKSKRWQKLQTKVYRDAYAEAQLSIEIPFQVRALRKARGWTQAKLAALCGIPQSRISHIEQPGRDPLSLRTLYRLSSAFDVGLLVQFVSFSELVHLEAAFNPVTFYVSSFKDDKLEEATTAVSNFEHDKLKKAALLISFKGDEMRAVEWLHYKVAFSEGVAGLPEWYKTPLKEKAKTEMPINLQMTEMTNLNATTLEPKNALSPAFLGRLVGNQLLSLKGT